MWAYILAEGLRRNKLYLPPQKVLQEEGKPYEIVVSLFPFFKFDEEVYVAVWANRGFFGKGPEYAQLLDSERADFQAMGEYFLEKSGLI